MVDNESVSPKEKDEQKEGQEKYLTFNSSFYFIYIKAEIMQRLM